MVPLRGEGDDVVGALQLREGVRAGIPLELHTAAACLAVDDACTTIRSDDIISYYISSS